MLGRAHLLAATDEGGTRERRRVYLRGLWRKPCWYDTSPPAGLVSGATRRHMSGMAITQTGGDLNVGVGALDQGVQEERFWPGWRG